MNPARQRQVEEIVMSALALRSEERTAYLDSACAGDLELRREVDSLLLHGDQASAFLETPALEAAARALANESGVLPGQMVGPYRINGLLGAGGMGEVYRAWDTRLQRLVALKFLPREYLSDAWAVKRFQREARAASALNHPNICTIYDVGDLDGRPFIAMEYLEGETLRARMGTQALPPRKVLEYAAQIANGLSAAHQKGIVHRDLKPENLWVTREDTIKILDFGLAKVESADDTQALTFSMGTEPGKVMGTVAYMSPEQVRGRPADHRSDIFSFGVILHEMLTGSRAFEGPSAADVMSRILNDEPHELADVTLDRLVRHCLEKQPDNRFQSVRDLAFDIDKLREDTASGRLVTAGIRLRPRRNTWALVGGAAALVAVAAIALGTYWKRAHNVPAGETLGGGRVSLVASAEGGISQASLSPDGKMIAYIGEQHGKFDLFVGRVVGGARVQLTSDGGYKERPHFSPDGERVAFTRYLPGVRRSEILVMPVLGGEPVRLLVDARDAAWSPDGKRIAFVLRRDSLASCAFDGTDVRILVSSESAYPYLRTPAWSPDGSQLVFARSAGGTASEVWLVSSRGGSPRRLGNDGPSVYSQDPSFTADGSGIVVTSNRSGASNLWYMPLNGSRPIRLTTGPGPDDSPSVARSGSITFVNTRMHCGLVVQNIATHETREVLGHSYYIWAPAFSPDGASIAYTKAERDGTWHIWIVPAQGGTPRQLTSGSVPEIYPRFSPDGASIFFHSWSPGAERIWRLSQAGGPAEAVTPESRSHDDEYADVSPDGRSIAFARVEKDSTRIYVAPLAGGAARRVTDVPSTIPRWSPDGKWIAFCASRDYAGGIFIAGADGSGMRRISATGGWPVWWPDGKGVAFLAVGPDGNQQILSVPLAGGAPKPLSTLQFYGTNYPFDLSRDNRFLATETCAYISSEIWQLEPAAVRAQR